MLQSLDVSRTDHATLPLGCPQKLKEEDGASACSAVWPVETLTTASASYQTYSCRTSTTRR